MRLLTIIAAAFALMTGAASAQQNQLSLESIDAINCGVPSTWTSFTPTATFATPGDESMSYTTQSGHYFKIGPLVHFSINIQFQPSYTTASGNLLIGGLPFTSSASGPNHLVQVKAIFNLDWPDGSTQMFGQIGNSSTRITLYAQGDNDSANALGATEFASGSTKSLLITGFYRTDS